MKLALHQSTPLSLTAIEIHKAHATAAARLSSWAISRRVARRMQRLHPATARVRFLPLSRGELSSSHELDRNRPSHCWDHRLFGREGTASSKPPNPAQNHASLCSATATMRLGHGSVGVRGKPLAGEGHGTAARPSGGTHLRGLGEERNRNAAALTARGPSVCVHAARHPQRVLPVPLPVKTATRIPNLLEGQSCI